jgi:hypothetical protein
MTGSESGPVPRAIGDVLLGECLGRARAVPVLRTLCDGSCGRTSGATSGHDAEGRAASLFRDAGFDDVAMEPLDVRVWERGTLDVQIVGEPGWRPSVLAHGFSPASCCVSGPLLDVGHGMPEDYERLGDLAKGAVVLCDEGAPEGKPVPHRSDRMAWAIEFGAAALIILSKAPGCLARTGVCHRTGSPIPGIGIAHEDGERLRRRLADGVRPTLAIEMANAFYDGTAHNVLAEIGGDGGCDEVVIAGAHLDCWDVGQGATDNALGCAIVLEAARALRQVSARPRRTIRFALWAAEETGLHGSRAHVAARAGELDQIAAVMNLDMTGDPYGYWTPGFSEAPPALRGLAKSLAPLGMREEFACKAGLHSDHEPFMRAGVPVVSLMGRLPDGGGGHYYHTAGDTYEKVSIPALCRAAAVAAHTLWMLADVPERLYARKTDDEVRAMLEAAGLKGS